MRSASKHPRIFVAAASFVLVLGSVRMAGGQPAARPPEAMPDSAFCLQWLYYELPSKAVAGTTVHGLVVVRNVSRTTWPDRKMAGYSVGHFAVRLSWRWGFVRVRGALAGKNKFVTGYEKRVDLEEPVAPGKTAKFEFDVKVRKFPGHDILQIDLVQEDVAWFGDRGSPILLVPITIVPSERKPQPAEIPSTFPSGHN